MKSFPKIETERLILKQIDLEEAQTITRYLQEPKMSQFTLTIPNPYALKDAIWWIKDGYKKFQDQLAFVFGIYLQNENKLIGVINLNILKDHTGNFGYWLAFPFWNKGYMTESLKAVLNFGFKSLNLNKIHAQHIQENPASGKVMQKAGMIQNGKKELILKNGKNCVLVEYRITEMEFKKL